MIKAHQAVQDILEGAETDFRRVWVICVQSFSSTAGVGHLNSTSSIVYLENRGTKRCDRFPCRPGPGHHGAGRARRGSLCQVTEARRLAAASSCSGIAESTLWLTQNPSVYEPQLRATVGSRHRKRSRPARRVGDRHPHKLRQNRLLLCQRPRYYNLEWKI